MCSCSKLQLLLSRPPGKSQEFCSLYTRVIFGATRNSLFIYFCLLRLLVELDEDKLSSVFPKCDEEFLLTTVVCVQSSGFAGVCHKVFHV